MLLSDFVFSNHTVKRSYFSVLAKWLKPSNRARKAVKWQKTVKAVNGAGSVEMVKSGKQMSGIVDNAIRYRCP